MRRRHPGLVPGSNVPQAPPIVDGWMPEQVRHDGCAERRVAPSAFELMHQLAHRAVDVAIAVAQFLDAADRVDHGRMVAPTELAADLGRSEEHTSELQSLMRSSYAVFCLKKKNKQ